MQYFIKKVAKGLNQMIKIKDILSEKSKDTLRVAYKRAQIRLIACKKKRKTIA